MDRIRREGEIVGYRRTAGNLTLYSRDRYGWNGEPIDHDAVERMSPYRDKNAIPLFENDVISIRAKIDDSEIMAVLLRDGEDFILRHFNDRSLPVDTDTLTSRDHSIKRVGYLVDG